MGEFLLFNNTYFTTDTPLITASNRAFKYGDGLFETILLKNGRLCFFKEHMSRLFSGLALLKFSPPAHFSPAFIESKIYSLLKKNCLTQSARVRLSVFRGSEDFSNPELQPNYIIESTFIEPPVFNDNGLVLGIYQGGTKNTDAFSNLKSNQYLLSSMSIMDATEKGFDEHILLNCRGNICESSKANIFCVVNNAIVTPSLTEGCVAGVIRGIILKKARRLPLPIRESMLTIEDLLKADEVFITNAIYPVRWVQSVGERKYAFDVSAQISGLFLNE